MSLRRAALIPLFFAIACARPAPLPGQFAAVSVAGTGSAIEPLTLRMTLEVRSGPVESGARVLIGFPHWYYGMRGERTPTAVAATLNEVPVPATARVEGWGRWYAEILLDRDAGPGSRLVVDLTAPATGVPGEVVPIVLFDRQGGDVPEPVREVPGLFVGPGRRPASRPARPIPPLVSGRRVVFADLHGHSGLSDGRGTPGGYFAFARRRGGVEVAALTDHDWQLDPREWASLIDAADAANDPGEFVALPGLETNVHGHETALFFDSARLRALGGGASGGALTMWRETDFGVPAAVFVPSPVELFRSLDGAVVTASHTTLARGMGSPSPRPSGLPGETCIEVYSSHGSSECADCGRAVDSAADDGPTSALGAHLAVRPDLCLLGAGDSHDGRPGDSRWGPWSGGLTGLEVESLTRRGVLDALRAGRTWATTGRRTVLELVGDRLRIDDDVPVVDVVLVDAASGREEVVALGDVRGEALVLPSGPGGRYVRVRSADGGLSWINPRRAAP